MITRDQRLLTPRSRLHEPAPAVLLEMLLPSRLDLSERGACTRLHQAALHKRCCLCLGNWSLESSHFCCCYDDGNCPRFPPSELQPGLWKRKPGGRGAQEAECANPQPQQPQHRRTGVYDQHSNQAVLGQQRHLMASPGNNMTHHLFVFLFI